MFGWLKKRRIGRKAYEYLQLHPEDQPIVDAVFHTHAFFGEQISIRDIAGMVASRKLSDEEWKNISPRWERAYYFIWR